LACVLLEFWALRLELELGLAGGLLLHTGSQCLEREDTPTEHCFIWVTIGIWAAEDGSLMALLQQLDSTLAAY
jgi:hypothetical protein